ncbi:Uncharacterised protein [Paucimonas lemoignei]|nr:Uncharacterised protein [Paucimonas lemoignei]
MIWKSIKEGKLLKKLLIQHLKTYDHPPSRRAFSATLFSIALAITPIAMIVAWDMLSRFIKKTLGFPWEFTGFNWIWLNELITKVIRWVAESIELLLPSLLLGFFGILFAIAYKQRNWVLVLFTVRAFKKVTAPFFIFYFSAFLVNFLIQFEFFYELDHLLNDWNLQNVVGSGKWVFLLTGLIWLMMSYASYKQIEIVRRERAEHNKNKNNKRLPKTVLDRLDRMRLTYIKNNTPQSSSSDLASPPASDEKAKS